MSDFKYLLLYSILLSQDSSNERWGFHGFFATEHSLEFSHYLGRKLIRRFNFTKMEEVFLALGLHQNLIKRNFLGLNTTLYWWDQVKKMTSSLKIFFQYVEFQKIIQNLILIQILILPRHFHFSLLKALSACKVWTSPAFCWFTHLIKPGQLKMLNIIF